MGRVTVFAATLGALLLFLGTCDASISVRPTAKAKQAKADPGCVSVRTEYGQSYQDSPVATCEAASALQTSQDRLERSVESQQGQLQGLQGDLAALQGNDSVLRPVVFYIFFKEALFPLCDIDTAFETTELARVAFGEENPNVHAVQIPCGDSCPVNYASLIRDCFPPRVPQPTAFVSPLYYCLDYKVTALGDPPCTRTLFISNRGYTPNVGDLSDRDDWLLLDVLEGIDVPRGVMAAVTSSLAAGDITPAAAMNGSLAGEGMTLKTATALRDALKALQSDP